MFKYQVKKCSTKINNNILNIYGISQNPDTKDYIIVLHQGEYHRVKCGKKYSNIFKWCRSCQTSGNEQIDDFIQEKQLKINWNNDIGFEWIPYNQFSHIEEISKGDLATIYSAIWKDGPLYYSSYLNKWRRDSHTNVTLKCLYYSPDIINRLLNEVCNL